MATTTTTLQKQTAKLQNNYKNKLQKHTTKTHYKNTLQKHTTKTHYKNTLQKHTTKPHYKTTLQNHTTKTHYKTTLQNHTTECTQNAHRMHTECTQECTQNAHRMHTECTQIHMHTLFMQKEAITMTKCMLTHMQAQTTHVEISNKLKEQLLRYCSLEAQLQL